MEIHVVLIDKNRDFLTSAQRFLESLPGVHATGFSTAERNVVSDLRQLDPDLVLLDITLPIAIRSRLENTIASFKKTPAVVVLLFQEKDAPIEDLYGPKYSGLVNKADFVTEIVPIIDNLRASAQAALIV